MGGIKKLARLFFLTLCLGLLADTAIFAAADAPFELEPNGQYNQLFTNHVDGYSLIVSNGMELDTSLGGVRSVLSDASLRVEIYRQTLDEPFDAYVSYGNAFIRDDTLYRVLYEGDMMLAGKTASVLEWVRDPLARVENDRCYYASVDLRLSGTEALTFLFKSAEPFMQSGGKSYIRILRTLTLLEQTAEAETERTETAENTHWNAATREVYERYFASETPVTWGIFEAGSPYEYTERFEQIEKAVNHHFRFLLIYSNLGADLSRVRTSLANAASEQRIVELTLQTTAYTDGKGNMLMDALDGRYDIYLENYAKEITRNARPVLFRLCNEMNGDWCSYSAYHTSKDTELFIAFYRYVYQVFEKNGALPYTIWVWNPNDRSYPDFAWNHTLCYYPGDEYVDVVGLTGYNTGTYYEGETWRSFPEIYSGLYRRYSAWFSQPFMITEFSCSSIGGDKAAWVREMFRTINSYPKIRVAIWWDGCDFDAAGQPARPYYITDEDVLAAFRQNLSAS